jgi:hypothetical protein
VKRSIKGSVEHPRGLQAALKDLREFVTAIGVSQSDAIEFVASVERLAHAFCEERLIGAVRDPLSPHKTSIKRLAATLGKASLIARDVQNISAITRDLSTYRRARDRKKPSLAYRDFVDQLDTWALAAERLLQNIEARRGSDADDAAHALYTRYALAFRRFTGDWPRGWRGAEKGGEPKSWRLLNEIVTAISASTGSRLTPKRFHGAVQRLAEGHRPVSKRSKK